MVSRVSSPVLIGRAEELGRLRAAFDGAASGRGQAVFVAGEAGVGKTRLVSELEQVARSGGAQVLAGGCIPLGDEALAYAPIVEALRGWIRASDPATIEDAVGPARGELARLVPDLGPADATAASELGLGSGQGRLFELLLGMLERLAARAPVLLVVEDLHWSDRSTRDLLAFLVRNARDLALTLVATYRSDELHRRHPLLPFLAELERSGRVERIELRPFDRRDVAAQLRAIEGRDVDARLIESIHQRSGGNAFFVEELLAAAEVGGELPATLRDVLVARVAELADGTQEFLRIASAAGQRVDPALLASAGAFDEDALYEALRESVARQVLVADDTGPAERYAFRHALLQEAVYDDLLPGERTRLHAAFARTLETRAADEPGHAAELAYHWYAAHDLPRALEASVRAGAEAEARYALPEALAHYERAAELWDQVPTAEVRAGCDRIDLLATLAGVARFFDSGRAVAHAQQAIAFAEAEGDVVRSGLLHERLGRFAWMAGQGALSNRSYETAMRLIPPDPPSVARARAVAGFAQVLILTGRFAEALPLAEEARDLAIALGARDIEGHATNSRGMARGIQGDLENGLADIRDALAIAEELGVVDDIGRGYANLDWLLEVAGRTREALEVLGGGIETNIRLGLKQSFGSHLLVAAGEHQFRLGDWAAADESLRRAEDGVAQRINVIIGAELRARLAIARGELDAADEVLRPVASLAKRAVDIQNVTPIQACLGELMIARGRPEVALEQLTTAIDDIDFSLELRQGELYALGLRAAADVAEVARARRAGDMEASALTRGERLIARMRERHGEVMRDRPAFERVSACWLGLCEAEAQRLRRVADPDAWASAAAGWQGLERPYAVAYARYREAEARLSARGDRAVASTALREARRIGDRLGAVALGAEITALATRARLSLDAEGAPADPAADPAASLGLTAREREVLALVAVGRTNRQIADELFISENTAGVHVSNILGKLGVGGRGEAAAVAYRVGLVEASTSRS